MFITVQRWKKPDNMNDTFPLFLTLSHSDCGHAAVKQRREVEDTLGGDNEKPDEVEMEKWCEKEKREKSQ